MHRICFTAGVLALCAVLGAVNSRSAKADDQPAKDIVDTAVGAGQFKTLVTAVKNSADLSLHGQSLSSPARATIVISRRTREGAE